MAEPVLNLDVSELQVNDEAVRLVVFSLALEAHHFALTRGLLSQSVEHQLPLVLGIIDSHLSDLLNVVSVPAVRASDIAAVRVGFSQEGYRLAAEAAKNGVDDTIDGDGDVF